MRIKKLLLSVLYILLLNPFGIFNPVFKLTGNIVRNAMLKCYGQTTKAKIIDEINYKGKRSAASLGFTYSYLFKVDGKKYKSDSEDSTFKIGDVVQVEYVKIFPNIHKLLHSNN